MKRTDDHKYLNDKGVEYPSVTKIIGWCFDGGKSDALIPWAVNQTCDFMMEGMLAMQEGGLEGMNFPKLVAIARTEATRKKEEAGDIGSRIHKYIEEWATDPGGFELAPFEDIEVKQAFAAFLDWANEVDLTPLETEIIVHNDNLKYAGTLDMIAWLTIDGKKKLYILDFKTSNYFYDVPYGTQLAAYSCAYGPEYPSGTPIEGIGVVRLDKATGKPHFRDYTPDEGRYLDTFLMFRKIFKIWREDGKTKVKRTKRKVAKGSTGPKRRRRKDSAGSKQPDGCLDIGAELLRATTPEGGE